MTSIVAVWLTLFSPYVFKIVNSLICGAFGSRTSRRSATESITERIALLNEADSVNERVVDTATEAENSALTVYNAGNRTFHSSHTHRSGLSGQTVSDLQDNEDKHDLFSILRHSESGRDFVWQCLKPLFQGEQNRLTLIVSITLALFLIFVSWTVLVLASAKMASDRTGLSSSTVCGIWQFDVNASDEAAYLDDIYNRRKEERASGYAQNCYNSEDSTGTLSCGVFYTQSIPFETKTQQACPFPSSELCAKGPYSAISFDTGLIDSSVIGINSPSTHKFRRQATCSPLNISESYISSHAQDGDDTRLYYNYGPTDDAAFTFNTSGHPFHWLGPVYSAK